MHYASSICRFDMHYTSSICRFNMQYTSVMLNMQSNRISSAIQQKYCTKYILGNFWLCNSNYWMLEYARTQCFLVVVPHTHTRTHTRTLTHTHTRTHTRAHAHMHTAHTQRIFVTVPTDLAPSPVCACDAVCWSVLQCVAVCCSVLQCVAVCCSVLQCVAVCCSVLQCVASPVCACDDDDADDHCFVSVYVDRCVCVCVCVYMNINLDQFGDLVPILACVSLKTQSWWWIHSHNG